MTKWIWCAVLSWVSLDFVQPTHASCGPRETSAILAAALGLGDSGIHSPLPLAFVQKLRETDGAKALAAAYQRGEGLLIDVYTGTGYVGLGESTQSSFLAKILREVLPDAGISRSGPDSDRRPDGAIRLNVTDSAEAGRYSEWMSDRSIQMVQLKLANPGPPTLPRLEVREKLGISRSARVVSANFRLGIDDQSIVSFVTQLLAARPDVVFISGAIPPENLAYLRKALDSVSDISPMMFSQLDGKPLDPGMPYVIVNNTVGLMHHVNAAANVAITVGPINILEPLLAGTPVVFFGTKSKWMWSYDGPAFEMMAHRAIESGGGHVVSNETDMMAKVRYLLNTPSKIIRPPYDLANQASLSTLNELLGQILHSIDFNAVDSGAFKKHPSQKAIKARVRSRTLHALRNLNQALENTSGPSYLSLLKGIRSAPLPTGLIARTDILSKLIFDELEKMIHHCDRRLNPASEPPVETLFALKDLAENLVQAGLKDDPLMGQIAKVLIRVANNRQFNERTRAWSSSILSSTF